MHIARVLRSSILAATIILAGTIFANPVLADPVVIGLGSLTGTVDPITYTTAAGTFTTSTILLTLNMSETSFFTVDTATGVITAHTVIDVTFNDGQGNDLTGTLFVDETGMLGFEGVALEVVMFPRADMEHLLQSRQRSLSVLPARCRRNSV